MRDIEYIVTHQRGVSMVFSYKKTSKGYTYWTLKKEIEMEIDNDDGVTYVYLTQDDLIDMLCSLR